MKARSRRPRRAAPPPIDPERLRAKAIQELLGLVSRGNIRDDGPRAAPPPFLLAPHAAARLLDGRDKDTPSEPAEYSFARMLLGSDTFGVCTLGLPVEAVFAGLVYLAMGARLPTIEEVTALRGKAAVAAGR